METKDSAGEEETALLLGALGGLTTEDGGEREAIDSLRQQLSVEVDDPSGGKGVERKLPMLR